MASLPMPWLVVGCILIVATLMAVVLSLLKSREAATLKKEVEELRDTIRMMRYEEANLSRMLHTVDKPADIQENVSSQDDGFSPELEDEVPAVPLMVEEDNSPIKENLEGDNEILAEEAQEVTELIETIEESDELVAEYAPEESLENEDESMVAAAAEAEAAAAAAAEEEEEEEEEEEIEGPIETEEEPYSNVAVAQQKQTDVKERVAEAPEIKSRKHAINERRPAIPNDLFSAWFEENEQYEAEQKEQGKEVVAEVEEAGSQKPESAEPQLQNSGLEQVNATPAEDIPTLAAIEVSEENEATTAEESVSEQSAVTVVLSKEDERFCRKLERVVNARMRNPNLNVDVIASQFGMGRTNFYRKVRELMGVSPNDYLRKCRMERAAELLCSSELTVADICAQVGIPDAQYFSRVFKTYFGMPPSIYREQKQHG